MSSGRPFSSGGRRRWDAPLAWYFARKTLESFRSGRLELVCGSRTYTGGDAAGGISATILVHDERFFSRVLWREEIGMGESFMDGDWSSPDLVAVARFAIRNLAELNRRNRFASLASRWRTRLRHALRSNSVRGSRRNIRCHYDLSTEFFRLFLDSSLAYSCAYFADPQDSLEAAQKQKFDLICRKLKLAPEDRLLEIGTGWGGLALHAAKHYGCRVTTTTISSEQFAAARELFRRAGPAGGRIELLSEDYRNLRGQFDKLVSVEMFEAVGFSRYDQFFSNCDRLLVPGGLMLLQTITVQDRNFAEYRRYADWIQTYIFPGSELSSVCEILKSLSRSTQLALCHAEEIGLHYARTLAIWRERFLSALPRVRALGFDQRFLRMWEYYLAICEASFLERNTGNVQLLLEKSALRPSPAAVPRFPAEQKIAAESSTPAGRRAWRAPSFPPAESRFPSSAAPAVRRPPHGSCTS